MNQNLSFINNPSIIENDTQTKNIAEPLKRRHDSLFALNDTIEKLYVELAEIKESIDAIDRNKEDKDFSADVKNIESRINKLDQKINHINGIDHSNLMRNTSGRASIISLANDLDSIDFNKFQNLSIITTKQNRQINQPKENKKMTEYEKQVIISNLSTIGLNGYQNNPALFDDYLYTMYKDFKENKVDNITTLKGYKEANDTYADMLEGINNDYLAEIKNNNDDYNAVVDKSAQDVLTIIFSKRWQQLQNRHNEELIAHEEQRINNKIEQLKDENDLKNKNEEDLSLIHI